MKGSERIIRGLMGFLQPTWGNNTRLMIRETARNSSPDRSENPRNEGRAKRSPKVGIVTESRIGFGSS